MSLLDLTSEGDVTNEPESGRAYELIGARMPFEPGDEFVNELVLVRSDRLATGDAAFERKVGAAARVVEIVQAASRPPFEVTVTGECTADRDINAILDEDLR